MIFFPRKREVQFLLYLNLDFLVPWPTEHGGNDSGPSSQEAGSSYFTLFDPSFPKSEKLKRYISHLHSKTMFNYIAIIDVEEIQRWDYFEGIQKCFQGVYMPLGKCSWAYIYIYISYIYTDFLGRIIVTVYDIYSHKIIYIICIIYIYTQNCIYHIQLL